MVEKWFHTYKKLKYTVISLPLFRKHCNKLVTHLNTWNTKSCRRKFSYVVSKRPSDVLDVNIASLYQKQY